MFKILSVIFWIAAIGSFLIGGIYGFYLSFKILNDISSVLAVIGLIFFPALYGVMPFYDLLANGNFSLLIINYGSMIAGGIFTMIAQWFSEKHEYSYSKTINGDLENADENINPSKWKYVGVFLLASGIANLIFKLLEPNLSKIYSEFESIYAVGLFSGFYSVIIDSLVYIIIYNQFKKIKISRVMPYIWTFYLLGKLTELGSVNIFDNGSEFAIAMLIYFGIAYFGFCLIFRGYFRNKKQWGSYQYSSQSERKERIIPTLENKVD